MGPHKPLKPPEPLTKAECELLLKAAGGKDALKRKKKIVAARAPTGVRNQALIILLWIGACRVGEALAVHEKDIDFDEGTVRILHGKGGIARNVGIDELAAEYLRRWRDIRATKRIPKGSPFICSLSKGQAGGFDKETRPGNPVGPAYVNRMLKRLAERAGIEKRVHAHGLRHSRAAQMVDDGCSLIEVQQALGHSAPSVTDIYVRTSLGKTRGVEAMKRQTWGDAPEEEKALREELGELQRALSALQKKVEKRPKGPKPHDPMR